MNTEAVAAEARGRRADYRLDGVPLDDRGGQAQVFRAIHKATGIEVAFKRIRHSSADAKARMLREVAVARTLPGHRHVMPVLDADGEGNWFVMPRALGNLEAYRSRVQSDSVGLRSLITSISGALNAAHAHGWVHRDVTPANILLLKDSDDDARWVLADWGLARGPRGKTTLPGRTRLGVSYGTAGFAAPELSVDAHGATPAADVYSLGQVIGWLLTGTWPRANVPLLPAGGPWRAVVSEVTRFDPSRRPQSIEEFLNLVASELDEPTLAPGSAGGAALRELRAGNETALDTLFSLAERHPYDFGLYVDVLPELSRDEVATAVRRHPGSAMAIAGALGQHVGGNWGDRSYKWADEVIRFAYRMAETASRIGDLNLLEEATEALLAWDEHWDQWGPQSAIRQWLSSVSGDAARVVAKSLRRHPASARHFSEVAENRKADGRIRAALGE